MCKLPQLGRSRLGETVLTMNTEVKKYMLVLDERLFYFGLLGHRTKVRRLGAASVYLAPTGRIRLRLGNEAWTDHELAIVPPSQSHEVMSDCGSIISVLIEPERLAPGEMDRLLQDFNDPRHRAAIIFRLKEGAMRLAEHAQDVKITTAKFDRIVLGREVRLRDLDPRIEAALEEMDFLGLENPSLAADLAESIGLSSSRFLHLFKEQTSVSFRNYRMWRRARAFLLHANHDSSLTDVALRLGYPDSSHFSHSIRRTFGLQPRSIRIGSRNLHIDSNARVAVSLQA